MTPFDYGCFHATSRFIIIALLVCDCVERLELILLYDGLAYALPNDEVHTIFYTFI
jgi:hypothetical protein